MKIKEYIESGALEAFALGIATEEETLELMQLKAQHPEINQALAELEADMERMAEYMAIKPPPDMLSRIENSINDLVITPETEIGRPVNREWKQNSNENRSPYIEVEAESSYMRIHKNWKWVFAAVFLLGKVFLACAIYFTRKTPKQNSKWKKLKKKLEN